MAQFIPNGAAELYHNGTKTFNTEANGALLRGGEGNNAILYMYADEGDDLSDKWKVETSGSTLDYTIYYLNQSSSWEKSFRAIRGSDTELYYDNSLKFKTISTGNRFYGSMYGGDDVPLYLGNANDFTLFHQAGGSSIIRYNHTVGGLKFRLNDNTDIAMFDSSGHFRPGADATYDLGTTSLRWRNIYTNDLNLSNEGGANDVDGTWGDWTIQEV